MAEQNVALIQVLGAVAYGEWKAYEGAKEAAENATSEAERRWHRQVAAEELRHHKGFVKRLEAMGADPERAMRPYHAPLDEYHGRESTDPVEDAVFSYLGEGIADDLLQWLRRVVDADTAAFIDTVIADEEGHEAAATRELRELLEDVPDGRAQAARAARTMHTHMLWSGRRGALPMAAFIRLGRTPELLAAILGGQARRLRAIGVGPLWIALPDRLSRRAA
jgi:rubrerythrin